MIVHKEVRSLRTVTLTLLVTCYVSALNMLKVSDISDMVMVVLLLTAEINVANFTR